VARLKYRAFAIESNGSVRVDGKEIFTIDFSAPERGLEGARKLLKPVHVDLAQIWIRARRGARGTPIRVSATSGALGRHDVTMCVGFGRQVRTSEHLIHQMLEDIQPLSARAQYLDIGNPSVCADVDPDQVEKLAEAFGYWVMETGLSEHVK